MVPSCIRCDAMKEGIMKKISVKWNDVNRRLDALWNRTESLIFRFFNAHDVGENAGDKPPGKDGTAGEEATQPLPKMTEFNVIVAAIKRLQEARIALLKEEARYETLSKTDDADSESVQEEISRVLKALEKNGSGETTDPDEMPD